MKTIDELLYELSQEFTANDETRKVLFEKTENVEFEIKYIESIGKRKISPV